MIETTVVIPHSSSVETLIAVLIQLQMQTVNPVHIYLIDCSDNKTGLHVAKKFAFNTIPITVEVVKGTIQENWNRGIIMSQEEHPLASILIINDDILIPIDAIEKFQKAQKMTNDLCYVPQTPDRTHFSNEVTTYFQSRSTIQSIVDTDWMSGFVFYLTARCIQEVGIFDESFKVWWGDSDYENRIKAKGKIKIINGLYVYHFGSRSYDYQSEEVRRKIDADRITFYNKYK